MTLARHDALFPLDIPGRSGRRLGPAAAGRAPARRRRDRARGGRASAWPPRCNELGPSFIKLGQILSTRADLLGERDRRRSRAAAGPAAAVSRRRGAAPDRGRVRAAARRAVRRVRRHVRSPPPRSRRCISRVPARARRSRSRFCGPGSRRAFARDIDLFLWLADLIERTQPALRRLKPVESSRPSRTRCSSRWTCASRPRPPSELAENFAGDQSFRVPRVDWLRTGRAGADHRAGRRHPDRRSRRPDRAPGPIPIDLLRNAAEAFFKQVFRDGFFHADMHPGQHVRRAGRGDRGRSISASWAGSTARPRYYLADMLVGFLPRDYRRVAEVHFARRLRAGGPVDRRLHPGLPLDRRADPRPAARTRSRSPGCSASCSTSPSSSTWRRSRSCCCCRRRWCWPRASGAGSTRGQHLGPGAAAGRGMDAREPRPRGANPGAAGGARRDPRRTAASDPGRSTRSSTQWAHEGVVLHAETLAMNAAHRARQLPLVVIPVWVGAAALRRDRPRAAVRALDRVSVFRMTGAFSWSRPL